MTTPSIGVYYAPPSGGWKSVSGLPIPNPPFDNKVGNNPTNWNIDASQAGTYYEYAIPVTTINDNQMLAAIAWANAYYGNKEFAFVPPYTADEVTQVINGFNDGINQNCTNTTKVAQVPVDPGAAIAGVGPINLGLPNFLGWLSSPNLWTRVGEFAFGGILLAIGISHLVGGGDVVKKAASVSPVGRVAKSVSKGT